MDRVVLITGASRGIGAATARLAAERGYAVCVNYRADRVAADRVVVDCRRDGGRAVAVQADVAVEADVVRLFEAVDRELGRVTALVSNAGILERQMRVEDMDAGRDAGRGAVPPYVQSGPAAVARLRVGRPNDPVLPDFAGGRPPGLGTHRNVRVSSDGLRARGHPLNHLMRHRSRQSQWHRVGGDGRHPAGAGGQEQAGEEDGSHGRKGLVGKGQPPGSRL